MSFKLSFVFATRNRLPFLKIALEKLISQLKHDEEIIVVDGNSKDGTQAYLSQLFNEKKIHQYISAPDKNQAHGWNKAMLLANGEIIKKIIDDDVFDYTAIRKCANYMINDPNIDAIISNDLSVGLYSSTDISYHSRLPQYLTWKNKSTDCFTFSDVHLLMRRSSLALIGLYNTSFTMLDWEYALRITSLKANLVYYTGYNALSVSTPNNITAMVAKKTLQNEAKTGKAQYGYLGDSHEISLWSKLKIAVGKIIFSEPNAQHPNLPLTNAAMQAIYDELYHQIAEINKRTPATFIHAV